VDGGNEYSINIQPLFVLTEFASKVDFVQKARFYILRILIVMTELKGEQLA